MGGGAVGRPMETARQWRAFNDLRGLAAVRQGWFAGTVRRARITQSHVPLRCGRQWSARGTVYDERRVVSARKIQNGILTIINIVRPFIVEQSWPWRGCVFAAMKTWFFCSGSESRRCARNVSTVTTMWRTKFEMGKTKCTKKKKKHIVLLL